MSSISIPRALLLAGFALSLTVSGAFAGSPAVDRTVRTGSAGATLHVTDLSAADGTVVVGWDETGGPAPEGGLASSDDAGASFHEWLAVVGYGSSRTDACPAPLYRIGAIGYPGPGGDRAMALYNGVQGRQLEGSGIDFLSPDVACVGSNVEVLAVLPKAAGGTHLIVWLFTPDLSDGPTGFDLGAVARNAGPVIVADGGWVHVAWMTGTTLKYKRFKVGSAPSYALSPRPTEVIETTSGQSAPQLGVDGKRVVLAWQRKASVVARVSSDRGVSFGARKTLFAGQASSAKVAFLDSADVRGATVIVAGTVSNEGITATGSVMRSTDNGHGWAKIPGTTRQQGFVYAALDGPTSAPVLHLAWDERFTELDPQAIRATSIQLP